MMHTHYYHFHARLPMHGHLKHTNHTQHTNHTTILNPSLP